MEIVVGRQLGGTSNLWGGRCLPFDTIDFARRQGVVDVAWLIRQSDILPYYSKACELLDCGHAEFVDQNPPFTALPDGFRIDLLERWSGTPQLQRLHRKTLTTSSLIDVRLGAVVVGFDFGCNSLVKSVQVVLTEVVRKIKTLVIACGGVESTRLLLATQRIHPHLFGGPDGPLGRYHMAHVVGSIAEIKLSNPTIDAAFDFGVDDNGNYIRRRFAPTCR
jgi:hypothetical protein